MNVLGAYIAAIHLQDLLDEAELERRAKLARRSQTGVPAWRRSLGGVLASAARSLDPCIEVATASRRSADGRGARAIAA